MNDTDVPPAKTSKLALLSIFLISHKTSTDDKRWFYALGVCCCFVVVWLLCVQCVLFWVVVIFLLFCLLFIFSGASEVFCGTLSLN